MSMIELPEEEEKMAKQESKKMVEKSCVILESEINDDENFRPIPKRDPGFF